MKPFRRRIRDVSKVTNLTVVAIGVVAATTQSAIALIARDTGWLEALQWWGSAFNIPVGGLIAFAYAFIFRSARRSGFGIGLNLACLHWLAAGMLAGLTPLGIFALGSGWASALIFFVQHLAYGIVVGMLFDRAAIRDEYPRSLVST